MIVTTPPIDIPLPTTFEPGYATDQFKELIQKAHNAGRLWIMGGPFEFERFQGPKKLGRLHGWYPAETMIDEGPIDFEKSAFAVSKFWLEEQKLSLAYVIPPHCGLLWEDAWYEIFVRLREVKICAAMLYNDTDGLRENPGKGLVLLSEGDAITASLLIDEIDFNS